MTSIQRPPLGALSGRRFVIHENYYGHLRGFIPVGPGQIPFFVAGAALIGAALGAYISDDRWYEPSRHHPSSLDLRPHENAVRLASFCVGLAGALLVAKACLWY